MSKKTIGGFLILVFLLAPLLFLPANSAKATDWGSVASGVGGALTKAPYGAKVIAWWPCTCNEDEGVGYIWMLLGPPNPGAYLYKPAQTKLYDKNNPLKISGYHLGFSQKNTGKSECSVYIYEDCYDFYYLYIMKELGTS